LVGEIHEDYKVKLAQEKLELLSIEVTPRKQQVGSMKVLDFNHKDCQGATLLVCDLLLMFVFSLLQ
jgi:hypothetical protein